MTTHNQESLLTKKMMQTITTIIPKLNQGKDGKISATLVELDDVETAIRELASYKNDSRLLKCYSLDAILRFKNFLSTQDVEYS